MCIELEGLRQLEDVRQQLDREHERHRRELEQQASVIKKLKQELAAERENTARFAVVSPGAGESSKTLLTSLHVHEVRSAADTGRRAVSSVLVDGVQDSTISEEISTKRVTFTEPGKVHETGTSVGDLGLSDSSSGVEIAFTEVTTSQSLSGGSRTRHSYLWGTWVCQMVRFCLLGLLPAKACLAASVTLTL